MVTKHDVEAAVEMANEGLGHEALAWIQTEAGHIRYPKDRVGFIVATADGPITVINGPDRWELL